MEYKFFNRILHLVNERPKQGKRMIGIGGEALWELWQRISAEEEKEKTQRNNPSSEQVCVFLYFQKLLA